jgi:myo-inositol 2-dehydrogenase/D-chiro-inositol 1-dehydrogenase/scyllo-inositol 2-dehydrogenase (NAD+)
MNMNEQVLDYLGRGQQQAAPLPANRKQAKERQVVRFCIVGAGRAGLIHARNIANCMPRAELVSLCDANAATLKQAGEELGVANLFGEFSASLDGPDFDAVVIATPTFLHRDIACQAAEQGKHVFLEKPMAVTVTECQDINAAAQRAGVKLQIGFMRRFDEAFIRARETLASGELGRVMIIKSTGRGPGGPGGWMYDLRKSNGIIAEVNSHDIDTLRWLAGQELQSVYAQAQNFKCPEARKDWPDFYDNVVAQFGFADRTMGVVDGTCPAHYGYDARVEVLCEKGVLFVGSVEQAGFTKVTVDGQVTGRAVKSWRTLFKDAYLAEMEHFVSSILKNTTPRVTGVDGQRAVEAVIAVNQSIRTGQPVSIKEDSPT